MILGNFIGDNIPIWVRNRDWVALCLNFNQLTVREGWFYFCSQSLSCLTGEGGLNKLLMNGHSVFYRLFDEVFALIIYQDLF